MLEAHDWYETQRSGLGAQFLSELEAITTRMTDNPHQFPFVFRDVLRARLRKFPYALFFVLETETIVVIACFHGSRDPQNWQQRI